MLLHIANTNFESELAGESSSNPIFLQLQFLPILYAHKDDGIGVTHAPHPSFDQPRWHLLDENRWPYSDVVSWGASPTIAAWAKKNNLNYRMPPWEVVQRVNSKAFSFTESPKLPEAALLHSLTELEAWDKAVADPKVLKTCYGVSGRGHLLLPSDRMKQFAEAEFQKGRAIIGEPWVKRKLDFSTQWIIGDQIEFVGSTICENSSRGQHIANLIGISPPNLEQHKEAVMPILMKMKTLGYFGHVGIDAMVWGDHKLHPVVEINARKTMGWVALEFAKHHFPKQKIRLSYLRTSKYDNLLPSAVVQKNGKLLHFERKLVVEIVAN